MQNEASFGWDDIKAFLAVARAGSTLAAARQLGVNQTTVVRRLEGLESAMGLRLIDRSATGSTLTDGGRNLLADAERMEAAATALSRRAEAEQRALTGALRVATTEAFAALIVEPGLADFRRRFPNLRIDLDLATRVVDLDAGDADVAVRGGITLAPSGLVARKLATFKVGIYCSRDYAERKGAPASPEQLIGHDLVVGDDARPMPGVAWLLDQAPDAAVQFRSNRTASLIQALRAGLGVGPLITLIGDQEDDLVRCFTIPAPPPCAWIVAPPHLKDAPRVRAFIDFIVPHFTARRRALEAAARG